MKDGGPAFPLKRDPVARTIGAETIAAGGIGGTKYEYQDQLGMSLRDYFAAHAPDAPSWWNADYLIDWRNKHGESPVREGFNLAMLSAWRFAYADAMLEARNPREGAVK